METLNSDEEKIIDRNIEIIKNVIKYGEAGELERPDVKQYNAQKLIAETCDEVKNMLLEKNRKYGNSALSPKRIFSKANPIEQINVRIDDKLSRIENLTKNKIEDKNESINDSIKDLTGYLILYMVCNRDKQNM